MVHGNKSFIDKLDAWWWAYGDAVYIAAIIFAVLSAFFYYGVLFYKAIG